MASSEACDDGNGNTTDGCVNCMVSPHYVCTGAPSQCTTAKLRLNNGTSFHLVSLVVDGVERIPARMNNMCWGYATGTYAEVDVTPNQSHTWTARNGGVTDNTTCNDLVHETWGPLTFTTATTYVQTLTNRALTAYLNSDSGYSYSCWYSAYPGAGGTTRVARLRLNNDGTWRFVETNTEGGPVLRQGNGTGWPETRRDIDFRFYFSLIASTVTWSAEWARNGGLYIDNGVVGTSTTSRVLYLRQTNGVNGPPNNCPQ